MTSRPPDPGAESQLERALAVYEEWLAADRPLPTADLLARHPDLAELLEAMLADRAEVERAVDTAEEQESRLLGDFRILGELGRGGMGVVYRARQRSLDREVALKVLPGHVTLDPDAVARFKREATLAARLDHPGIVKVHAVGGDGDAHFFAMELVDGRPLDRRDPKTGQPRSVRRTVELAAAVCDALAYAHAHGVLHRDVKPSNILVRRDGRPVLTDFGLARDLDDPGLTKTGAFAGTPYYAAPEQATGRRDIDARVDVFGLGATLYELLTGQRPFGGGSAVEVLDRIVRDDPVDPLRLAPDLAPDLAAVVLKALEKDPARRYGSAAAFAADLRAVLEFRPIAARRTTGLQRLSRWARREPFRAALAATLLVGVPVVTGVVGYLIANRGVLELGSERARTLLREERLARITIDHEAGDYGAALSAAAAAVAADPHDVEARVLRALAQLAAGQRDEVLEQLDRTPGPDAGAEQRGRALVLTALGRDDEARAVEAALGVPATPEQYFLAGCLDALRARRRGDDAPEWREVRDTFARAMHLVPAPRLHYHLRWITATQQCGSADELAAAVQALRALWPDSPAALLYVAYSLQQSDPAQAVADYRRVLAAGYDHPRIHSTIARCLVRLGDEVGAAAAGRSAVASFRARADAGRATPDEYVNIAITLGDLGEQAAAVAAARTAAERYPDMPRAFVTLGWLLEQAKDLDGATTALRRAAELRPDDPDPHQRLGTILLRRGDSPGAADAFRRWVALRPDVANPHFNLGVALQAAGDTPGARAAFQRAHDLATSESDRATIAARLAALDGDGGR